MTTGLDTTAIKVITEPSVYLIGKQQLNDAELDRFLADHGVTWESDSEVAAEVITETAGRVCYMSFAKPRPGGNAAYLGHIKETSHGSVLEHAVWTFMITGVSRSLTHELVRHRAGFGYSQLSQRYVDESIAEYVEPDIIANDYELHEIWLDAVGYAHRAYVKLVDKLNEKLVNRRCRLCADGRISCDVCNGTGWIHSKLLPQDHNNATVRRKTARQAARSVLPNATETKITVTLNARSARHFLEQRGSVFADPEIRKLANKVLDILQVEAPNLFGDYQKTLLPDGTFDLQTPFRKV